MRGEKGKYRVQEEKNQTSGHSDGLKAFIRENGCLWWRVPEEKKERLSLNSVVEAVLNYGNEKDVKRLFELVGTKKVSEIFFRQIAGGRPNYSKRTMNFFKLYFERNAPGNTH